MIFFRKPVSTFRDHTLTAKAWIRFAAGCASVLAPETDRAGVTSLAGLGWRLIGGGGEDCFSGRPASPVWGDVQAEHAANTRLGFKVLSSPEAAQRTGTRCLKAISFWGRLPCRPDTASAPRPGDRRCWPALRSPATGRARRSGRSTALCGAGSMCQRNRRPTRASISGLRSGPPVPSSAIAALIASACGQLRETPVERQALPRHGAIGKAGGAVEAVGDGRGIELAGKADQVLLAALAGEIDQQRGPFEMVAGLGPVALARRPPASSRRRRTRPASSFRRRRNGCGTGR